jgi:hypothetical protein
VSDSIIWSDLVVIGSLCAQCDAVSFQCSPIWLFPVLQLVQLPTSTQ